MSTAAKKLEKMQILTRDYSNAVREANNYVDERYTAEGLRVEREGRVRRANDLYGRKLSELRAEMKQESDYLKASAVRSLPTAQGSTRDNWERVKMLLDAGQPLAQVIAKADAGSLHAIREWGPTWLDAQSHGATTDLAPFERSITQRWAEIVADPEPIREFLAAAKSVATFEYMAGSLSDQLDGRSVSFGSLENAFAAQLAGQMASVDLASSDSFTSLGAA